MKYRGYEIHVAQTTNSAGWTWTVQIAEGQFKTGTAFSRQAGVRFAQLAIDKIDKPVSAN
jgi:hypothetical protein